MYRLLLAVPLLFLFMTGAAAQTTNTDTHPILSETEWINAGTTEDYVEVSDGTKFVWRVGTFFVHANGLWKKAEYTVFGELVVKSFKIRNPEGKVVAQWFQLEKDGVWHTVKNGNIHQTDSVAEGTGKLVITLVLSDKTGKEIVSREIKQK